MKILHTAPAIRSHIRDVLSDEGDDRHAFVAFVGPNPIKYVKHWEGLSVYCWPLAGATHPAGVALLRKEGAKVTFVEGLHAKVYHSSRGTVIGSANLSANALQGKLLETAIWLPPGAFSWKSQMAQARKRTVYEADALHSRNVCRNCGASMPPSTSAILAALIVVHKTLATSSKST